MAFEDVLWAQGKDNMGGLVGPIYFVPVEDLDWTTPPALGADGVTISGDIVLGAGKKFIQIYQTRGTSKIDSNVVGERDGRSYENIAEFKFPGDTPEVLSFLRQVANTPGVVIAKDPQGKFRVIGLTVVKDTDGTTDVLSKDFPAYLEAGAGTTGTGADAKGHTISFKAESLCPPLFYTGDIDLDDTP